MAAVDFTSAVSVLNGTAPTRIEPTTGRTVCLHCLCRAAAVADELCERHIANVVVDDITWLSRDEAIVEWRFAHSGFVSTSILSVEFEGADRSVGINESYFTASGDNVPSQIEELVAESASLRAADDGDDYEERDWDSEREYQDDLRAEAL